MLGTVFSPSPASRPVTCSVRPGRASCSWASRTTSCATACAGASYLRLALHLHAQGGLGREYGTSVPPCGRRRSLHPAVRTRDRAPRRNRAGARRWPGRRCVLPHPEPRRSPGAGTASTRRPGAGGVHRDREASFHVGHAGSVAAFAVHPERPRGSGALRKDGVVVAQQADVRLSCAFERGVDVEPPPCLAPAPLADSP